MLTRIEIDGFKTFDHFAMELAPFVAIAGVNAAGKSNLFDAIRLLSRLADHDLRSAVSGLRGDPAEIFRRHGDGEREHRIHLAVEVLLAPSIRDPWGTHHELRQTRLRYELVLEERKTDSGLPRLYVTHESAIPIRSSADAWVRRRDVSATFRQRYLHYRRPAPFLETLDEADRPEFRIAQDGSPGRKRPANAAEATVLSSITSAEFVHLYALREELRSWRMLQLDPAALREPSPFQAPEELEPSGANLPRVLARLRQETADEANPDGVLGDMSSDLAAIIPGLEAMELRQDEATEQWQVWFHSRGEAPFSSRVASDGTLRMLGLLAVLSDPTRGGVTCFEEPENGVHPARLRTLIAYLRDLVIDLEGDEYAPGDPLVQLLVTTHSPVVVAALDPGEGVYFDTSTDVVPGGTVSMHTRARAIDRSLPLAEDGTGPVSQLEVEQYLATAVRAS